MRNKGFSLLELSVVIIILGILAVFAVPQFSKVVERSRAAEARVVLGAIRTNAAAIYMEKNSCEPYCSFWNIAADYPGPAAVNCRPSHYFWYDTGRSATSVTIIATRCLAGGKEPQGVLPAGTLQLDSVFSTGVDTWSGTLN